MDKDVEELESPSVAGGDVSWRPCCGTAWWKPHVALSREPAISAPGIELEEFKRDLQTDTRTQIQAHGSTVPNSQEAEITHISVRRG